MGHLLINKFIIKIINKQKKLDKITKLSLLNKILIFSVTLFFIQIHSLYLLLKQCADSIFILIACKKIYVIRIKEEYFVIFVLFLFQRLRNIIIKNFSIFIISLLFVKELRKIKRLCINDDDHHHDYYKETKGEK